MIRDRPDGAMLRALAAAAIERGEDPALVTRALAIAEREAASGTAPVEGIRARLVRRYGDAPIETLLARLAAEIRAGAFDAKGPAQAELQRLLWDITLLKLAESNPEYLAAARVAPI
jgi:Domain of unknown function (DUF6285)